MTKQLYMFWGVSAGLSSWLIYKMWKERQRYVEVSDKVKMYGVLGVSDLMALDSKINDYELHNFNQTKVGNEHLVMVSGELWANKPYMTSKSQNPLIYHVSFLSE